MSMTPVQEAQYALNYNLAPGTLKGDARTEYDRLAEERQYRREHPEEFPAPAPAPKPVRVQEDRTGWPPAVADGLAVGALVASLVGAGGLGIILGAIHITNSHKAKQRASAVGVWGLWLGIAESIAWTILIVVLIAASVAVSHATYQTGA